jgi:hypothetical protein
MINQWTREDLRKSHGLTVGDILEFVKKHKVPRTARVLVERIEDAYFNGIDISGMSGKLEDGSYGILPPGSKSSGWRVYLKKGESWWQCQSWNDDIDSGKYLDADQYPRMQGKELKKYTEDQLIDSMTQYIPAFCCVKYNDEEDVLLINIHY